MPPDLRVCVSVTQHWLLLGSAARRHAAARNRDLTRLPVPLGGAAALTRLSPSGWCSTLAWLR
jgi:hypothetical protein